MLLGPLADVMRAAGPAALAGALSDLARRGAGGRRPRRRRWRWRWRSRSARGGRAWSRSSPRRWSAAPPRWRAQALAFLPEGAKAHLTAAVRGARRRCWRGRSGRRRATGARALAGACGGDVPGGGAAAGAARSRRRRCARPGLPAARGASARAPRFTASLATALRRKEHRLLWRDPWLLSQMGLQALYTLPIAFILWRNGGVTAHAGRRLRADPGRRRRPALRLARLDRALRRGRAGFRRHRAGDARPDRARARSPRSRCRWR